LSSIGTLAVHAVATHSRCFRVRPLGATIGVRRTLPQGIARRRSSMPAKTFNWRDDPSGTIIAVPQVRARCIRVTPDGGAEKTFHTHEESEAIETWVVLEGKVRFEFEIEGERSEVVAGPGQAVVALPNEMHRITCAGDEPAVYF